MDEIVFIENNTKEPFTTSKVIAEFTGMNHRRVKDAIRKHENEILSFGLLGECATESTGGRPEEIYMLNEQQAAFLMTLLKNTEKVVEFKAELVRQFYAMREEIYMAKLAKIERKQIRGSMTDAIKSLPESPHKKFKYKQYTDLAYKLAIGKTAKQIREERRANKKDTASDFLTAKELEAVSNLENHISVLLNIGMEYEQIKESLSKSIISKQ